MIRVENLGKKYMIGHQAEGRSNYVALRDVLADGAKSLVKRFTGRHKGDLQTEEGFWALKDVSFEVKRGECVGIIGRNGAGKSTLLKILSRITEPTTGRVELHGRVASLLEVGTGFHPELTGRENIYLNGAILGMTRAEIKKKFDEIVDFAEVERFLDTPVKRYSSGMYVRLAFAVAAHLEPEILVVDEVLAVGDAAFQKKCLGKMGEVSEKEGRTVLFVSHQMTAIQNLCNRGVLLKKGEIKCDGHVLAVIEQYTHESEKISNIDLRNRIDRKGNGAIRFSYVELKNNINKKVNFFLTGQDLKIIIYFDKFIASKSFNFKLHLGIDNILEQRITWLTSEIANIGKVQDFMEEKGFFEIILPKLPLLPSTYYCTIYCELNGDIADWVQKAFSFRVEAGDFYKIGRLLEPIGGFFLIDSYNISINMLKN
jgi:lipopolysaccharide transport system ATP-binding protein